jgi:PAS domain-containing protein
MTEDAAPFESHADDLARLRRSVSDLGGRTALERVVQRLSELAADNEALRTQVTERGSAQEAQPGIENQSSLTVNSIPGLVATLTPDGEVELVNDQVLQYCGGTLREMLCDPAHQSGPIERPNERRYRRKGYWGPFRQHADQVRIEKCRLTDDAGQNIVF